MAEIQGIVEASRELFLERWHEHFGNEVEPLAVDVECTDDALKVILADGREISVPLVWSPRLLRATPE